MKTENQPEYMVRLRDVTVRDHERVILSQLCVSIPWVSGWGIVGLSGSGKTTLMRALLGLIEHEGSIDFLGHSVSDSADNRALYRRIGVLFQRAALFNDLTVQENCLFSQELSSTGLVDRLRIEQVLRTLNLWDARHLLPRKLSGGMQHRAGLARVLVRDCACLILDEPTTGQDKDNATMIQTALLEYQQEQQGRLVVISHDYAWLKPLVQWSVLIHAGHVAYEGPHLMTFKPSEEIVPC